MEISYYAEGDVIYVSLPGNDEYAITSDAGWICRDERASVLLRHHPVTGNLVGVTIIDFVESCR
jgi:hypothetical protein